MKENLYYLSCAMGFLLDILPVLLIQCIPLFSLEFTHLRESQGLNTFLTTAIYKLLFILLFFCVHFFLVQLNRGWWLATLPLPLEKAPASGPWGLECCIWWLSAKGSNHGMQLMHFYTATTTEKTNSKFGQRKK